jgi:hypothetical protein
LRNSENIWSREEIPSIPLLITGWNIQILAKMVKRKFQEELIEKPPQSGELFGNPKSSEYLAKMVSHQ